MLPTSVFEQYVFHAALRVSCPPKSHIMKCMFFQTTSSTLDPMVGDVCTTSFIRNWQRIVVLPALSRPTMQILCSEKTRRKRNIYSIINCTSLHHFSSCHVFLLSSWQHFVKRYSLCFLCLVITMVIFIITRKDECASKCVCMYDFYGFKSKRRLGYHQKEKKTIFQ